MIHSDKKKMIIFFVASVLWMMLIFYFSGKNGGETNEQSGSIVNMITETVNIDATKDTYDIINFLVRKAAHFCEYAILAVFFMLTIVYSGKTDANKIRIGITTLLCCIYAITDEIHQHFTDGRQPAVRDVIIDTAGGLVGGIVALFVIYKLINRGKEVKTDDSRKDG